MCENTILKIDSDVKPENAPAVDAPAQSGDPGLCPVCGKEFVKNKPKQIFCSKKCKNRHYSITRKAPKAVVKCQNCGKEFVGKSIRQRFCSAECYRQSQKIEKNDSRKSEREEYIEISLNRKCHDCGRPTSDYRCADCRRKFNEKHNVPIDGGGYGFCMDVYEIGA